MVRELVLHFFDSLSKSYDFEKQRHQYIKPVYCSAATCSLTHTNWRPSRGHHDTSAGKITSLPQDMHINLDTETVGVVGVGNVSVDLARMILTPVDILRWLYYSSSCKIVPLKVGFIYGCGGLSVCSL